MITMCCEVSYLYIGLLTQLFYLTYVGFLNIFPQTQGVIFNIAFEFGYKRIAQISWLNLTWLESQLDGSAAWILTWRLRSQLGLVESWLDGSNRGSVA